MLNASSFVGKGIGATRSSKSMQVCAFPTSGPLQMSASHITLVKDKIKRPWSFSGLATMIRILLMSYVSIQSFFEQPHRDWDRLITQVKAPPEELSLFQWGAWNLKLELIMPISAGLREYCSMQRFYRTAILLF